MWQWAVDRFLKRTIQDGTLVVTWPDGSASTYGKDDPRVGVTIHDRSILRPLALKPEVALGEAYTEGHLSIENDDVMGLMTLAAHNAKLAKYGRYNRLVPRMALAAKRFNQNHGLFAARRNAEHHYDLSADLYTLFLDDDLQYTCGYFPSDNMTIEAAQDAKKALIARKLMIEPDMRVMDIGCGWGGLAIALARDHGARVVGVTLSQVQKAHAERRIAAAGLADRIEIRLTDYRAVAEEFDRIVVVGMLEHVGQPQYATFFAKLRQNLAPNGIALVHTIGRSTPPSVTAPWIGKYIFPGSYIPALSEVATEIERNDLILTDLEVWRMHYVHTLRAWRDRFEANRDRIGTIYDARFIRMWRFYLVVSEIGFTHLANVVFQFQITRHQTAAPLTRDYLLQAD